MRKRAIGNIDNRDAAEMYAYLEARIDALKRRITELEAENQALRHRSSFATSHHMSSEAALNIAS